MSESIAQINDPDTSIQTVAQTTTIREETDKPQRIALAEQSPDEISGKASDKEALSSILSRVNVDDGEDLISSFITSTKPGEDHQTNAWMSNDIEGLS